jgi:hypothetical protein
LEVTEQPIWIRNIITKLEPGCFGESQHTVVKVRFAIGQHGKDPALITAMEIEK